MKATMALSEHERIFIQNQSAPDFHTYLKSVWRTWPTLTYNKACRKTSILWKARKELLKSLTQKRCSSCQSSFHTMWGPLAQANLGNDSPKTTLTVTEWQLVFQEPPEISCWGCKEGLANQQGHMEYGGCLYQSAIDMDLSEPIDLMMFPPLPPSPK